ncbi:ribosomal protein S5 domain 2-type protein [Schizothecium vesticola]|uniref:Phosphomevalonate kinase n=1 Tax=Schizothecium vesticola TaxID=314040 RepID=A0AA40EWE8_9PEZI|nr:ribosomal protein S5 domain 2-type protein [Schizothecium vesticola]
MSTKDPLVAVSAPGKVMLAGGYLVLDRAYTGLVFGLSARINVVAQEIHTSQGVHLTEIVVESPQFLDAQWRYGYHLADHDGGIKVTQLQVGSHITPNPFVETTLNFALTYIARVHHTRRVHSARLTILADNDYYSQPSPSATRFAHFPVPLSAAHKTGLGSSAALVTALTAALLTHYLDPSLFSLATPSGRQTLHNLAQAAHCAAQGKVGSGFDVAAAVYGSARYRRFSPGVLAALPEPGAPGFATALEEVAKGAWDVEVDKEGVGLPKGVAVRMCDVDCGSQTVGMVKGVLAWRGREGERAAEVWDALQGRNEELAGVLREGRTEEIRGAVERVRELVRRMGEESGVPIEPESQTALLDGLSGVEGVFGGVVPGAGGYDALALLVRDDEETAGRVRAFLEAWGKEKGVRVSLMDVKGEMEGVREEDAKGYGEWIR